MLSGLSHCAGVVVAPKINVKLRHIEFVTLAPGRALVVLVNEDGSVENRAIDVPVGLPPSALNEGIEFPDCALPGQDPARGAEIHQRELANAQARVQRADGEVVEAGIATWSGSDGTGERH